MSVLKILRYPDNRLRTIAKPVIKINNSIRHIVDDMLETMYAESGIGLAATQVDIHLQIIVIDISESRRNFFILINPQFINKSGEIKIEEGCLSIPNQYGFVLRSKQVIITAINLDGKRFELKANDLLSVCIQHEMDHLIGALFIDYFSFIKRQRIIHRMKKTIRKSSRIN